MCIDSIPSSVRSAVWNERKHCIARHLLRIEWQRDTVAQFMAHAVEWLVKWTVWSQIGRWLGPEMPHDLGFLLRKIRPEQECHCGSGKQYRICHRAGDEGAVKGIAPSLPRQAITFVGIPHWLRPRVAAQETVFI